MKFENTSVFNFEGAMRGMRNPKNSWNKGDSGYGCYDGAIKGLCRDCDGNPKAYCALREYVIGQNDLALAQSLIKAGSEHRKFMRQIFVSVDITAPMYWWKEFDTYKVGTVANSTSTMHKLASTPITMDCFEMDDFEDLDTEQGLQSLREVQWSSLISWLEDLRRTYNETKDKRYWKELIRLLPESWLQKRTVTMDYENLLAICSKGQRRFHKLTEWSTTFISWARTLPYAQELIFLDELEEKKNG
jgi:hypothetical protein